MEDALAPGDDEGRGKLRKATGRCKQPSIRRCPNGKTCVVEDYISLRGSKPGELKHLSNQRKRNQPRFP